MSAAAIATGSPPTAPNLRRSFKRLSSVRLYREISSTKLLWTLGEYCEIAHWRLPAHGLQVRGQAGSTSSRPGVAAFAYGITIPGLGQARRR